MLSMHIVIHIHNTCACAHTHTQNSYGYDTIPTKIMKISTPYISTPLTYLCNTVLASGLFMSCLKSSQIKPFDKKGENNIANYK